MPFGKLADIHHIGNWTAPLALLRVRCVPLAWADPVRSGLDHSHRMFLGCSGHDRSLSDIQETSRYVVPMSASMFEWPWLMEVSVVAYTRLLDVRGSRDLDRIRHRMG
jgi:hypothetical protein